MSINQNEWLSFLDTLHNSLRNSTGIKLTGLSALTEISNFMLFRFLDNNLDIKLDESLKFYHMYNTYATDEKIKQDLHIPDVQNRNSYKLWQTVYDSKNPNCLIAKYYNNPNLNKYLDSAVNRVSAYINKPQASETIQSVVNLIYKKFQNIEFTSEFYDMFGSAYEQFKTNSASNSGKDTGQHFTNVFIKQIVINELKPKSNEIFYEPCAGSGGFVHTADHYISKLEGIEPARIFKKNLHANECNPEIFRPLILNMLFHNIPIENIKEMDSLSDQNIREKMGKIDLVATNFPFGISTTLKSSIISEIVDYWNPIKTGKNIIKNSTGQFIIHILNSLKVKGRCGMVSDRGILNNGTDSKTSWQTKLRKYLFENHKVYKIILLPVGSFTYTNFSTCIIFIKKGKATKKCKIYNAEFKVMKDYTSEIVVPDEATRVFKIGELRENNYNLKIGDEKEDGDDKNDDGIEWVKLGDVCEIKRGKSLPKNQIVVGNFPVITGCNKINNYHNEYNCNGIEYIFMARVGSAGSIMLYDNNCYLTDLSFALKTKNDSNSKLYVYYYLKFNKSYLDTIIETNGPPNINGNKLLNDIKIPHIPLIHQQEIVTYLDQQFINYKIEQITSYTSKINIFKLLLQKRYDECTDVLYTIYRKIEQDEIIRKIEQDKKAIFGQLVGKYEGKECKLGDVCEFKRGKIITASTFINGEYPVIGGGKEPSGYHNMYNRPENTILISQSGSYAGYVSKYDTKVWASDCFSVNSNNSLQINNLYLYYYLKFSQDKIYKLQHGNGQPHVNTNDMIKFKIKLPSPNIQQYIVNRIEQIESFQKQNMAYLQMLEQEIDTMNLMIDNNNNNNNITEFSPNASPNIDLIENDELILEL